MNPSSRAGLLRRLAALQDAGLSGEATAAALARESRGAPAAAALLAAIRAGATLDEAFRRAGAGLLSPTQRLALAAAERAGRAPEVLRDLAEEIDADGAARRELLRDLAYPVLLFHLAPLACAAGTVVADGPVVLLSLLKWYVPFDLALILLARSVVRAERGQASFATSLPGLSGLLATRARRRFVESMGRLYDAGIPIRRAATEALATMPPGADRSRLERALAADPEGPLADALGRANALPSEILALLHTHEPVGELSQAFRRGGALLADEERATRRRTLRAFSAGIRTLVLIIVGYQILAWYGRYFGRIGSLR